MIKRYGLFKNSDNGYETVLDTSSTASYFNQEEQNKKKSINEQVFEKVLGKDRIEPSDDSSIFKKLNASYRSHTMTQKALEGLDDLNKKPVGSNVFFYDTEILGTATHNQTAKNSLDFYHLTEIAMQKTEIVEGKNGVKEFRKTGDPLSLLVKPTEKVNKQLQKLIEDFKENSWSGMTPDQRRTLSDLALYAGDPSKLFSQGVTSGGNKIGYVQGQSRELKPLEKAIFTKSDFRIFQQGLNNINNHGTRPQHIAEVIQDYTKNAKDAMLSGYNVYNFDQPMIMDYLDTINNTYNGSGKMNQAGPIEKVKAIFGRRQMDLNHAANTIFGHSFSIFGENKKLETYKKKREAKLKVKGNMSHFGVDDVYTNIDMANEFVFGKNKLVSRSNNASRFNKETYKRGDYLYSFRGQMGKDAGYFDSVFDLETNKAVSNYRNSSALYNQTAYQIGGFHKGIELEDNNGVKKKQWGITLLNPEENLAHVIFKNSEEELQEFIHGNLKGIKANLNNDGELEIDKRYKISSQLRRNESALRSYQKIFSTENGGGVNHGEKLYSIIDRYADLKMAKLSESEIKNILLDEGYKRVDIRNAKTMAPRLNSERSILEPLFKKVKEEKGSSNKETKEIQGRILSAFRDDVNAEFGENTHKQPTYEGQGFLKGQVNGKEKNIVVKDIEQIRSSIYSFIYNGKRPEADILQNNMRQFLGHFNEWGIGQDKKYMQKMKQAISNVSNKDSVDTIVSEWANIINHGKVSRNDNLKLNIQMEQDIETVNEVNQKRQRKINNKFSTGFDEYYGELSKIGYSYTNGHQDTLNLTGGFKNALTEHDRQVSKIYNRMGLTNSSQYLPDSSESVLNKVVGAYKNKNFEVKLMMDKEKEKYLMFFTDKNNSKVLGKKMEDLLLDNSVGRVDIPLIGKDGMINFGGTPKVNNLFMNKNNIGGVQFTSGFDIAMNSIAKGATTARNQIEEALSVGKSSREGMERASSIVQSTVKKRIQSLTSNTKYFNNEDKSTSVLIKSNAAKYIRESVVDLTGLSSNWYEGYYNSLSKEQLKGVRSIEEIKESMSKNYTTFFEEMDKKSRNTFQRQVEDIVRGDLPGMKFLNAGSIKDTQVINGLRGTTDVRSLIPFGFLNPLTRENIQKTVNYESLDTKKLKRTLKLQGKSESEIERIISRRVTTDVGMSVFEENVSTDKTSFLNLKTGYMDDRNIQGRLDNALKELESKIADPSLSSEEKEKASKLIEKINRNKYRFSTYDGVAIISEEVSELLNQTRERKFKLGKSSTLEKNLSSILAESIGETNLDLSKNIDFNNISLDLLREKGLEIGKDGKITMGEIVKNEYVLSDEGNGKWTEKRYNDANGIYKKWNVGNTTISHWDAESRTLVMNEEITGKSTTKGITDTGGRHTFTVMDKELMKLVTGVDGVEMIMPEYEVSKKMQGTQVSSMFNTAVEEVLASKKTMGSVEKERVLNKVSDLFNQHVLKGEENLVSVRDGKVIFNSTMGVDSPLDIRYKDISNFYEAVDNNSGLHLEGIRTNLMNLGDEAVSVHYVGLGKQAMDDWERGVGFNKGMKDGVLQFGIKETQLVKNAFEKEIVGGSKYAKFLDEYISSASKSQSQWSESIPKALTQTVSEGKFDINRGSQIGKNDIVIRTDSQSFGVDDPTGEKTGRINNKGQYELSFHGYTENPSSPDYKVNSAGEREMISFTNRNYEGTMMDFASKKITFEDGKNTSDLFKNNNNTALLQLPVDPETGESMFDRSHVRLIDYRNVASGNKESITMFSQVEDNQKRLFLAIKELQNVGNTENNSGQSNQSIIKSKKERITQLLNERDEMLAKSVSSIRDGSIVRETGYARFDMSGQFRAQPISPFEMMNVDGDNISVNKNSHYKEGVSYVGKERLFEMINGSESNIMELWKEKAIKTNNQSYLDEYKNLGDISNLSTVQKQKFIERHTNTMGINGTLNRFPSIKEDTIRATQVMIDTNAEKGYRGIRVGAGLAGTIKGDFDGDFYSLNLSHYGRNDFSEPDGKFVVNKALSIEEELETMGKLTRRQSEVKALSVIQDLNEDAANIKKRFSLSIGEMKNQSDLYISTLEQISAGSSLSDLNITEAEHQRSKEVHEAFQSKMVSKYTNIEEFETTIARLSKEQVGSIDNERFKMLNLADTTMGALAKGGLIGEGVDQLITEERRGSILKNIEELGAVFSQDSISAKKFDIAKEVDRLKDEGLTLEQAQERAKINFLERHQVIDDMTAGLRRINTPEGREAVLRGNEVLNLYTGDEVQKLHTSLDDLGMIQRLSASAKGQENISLSVGISEGKNFEKVQGILNGNSGMLIPTSAMKAIHGSADETTRENLERGFERFEDSVNKKARMLVGEGIDLTTPLERPNHPLHTLDTGMRYSADRMSSLRGLADTATPYIPKGSGTLVGGLAIGAGLLGASSVFKGGPTPEAMQENFDNNIDPSTMVQPTARVVQNKGDMINLSIRGKDSSGKINQQEIMAAIQSELNAMTRTTLDTNLSINDNRGEISTQWVQDVVASAMNK